MATAATQACVACKRTVGGDPYSLSFATYTDCKNLDGEGFLHYRLQHSEQVRICPRCAFLGHFRHGVLWIVLIVTGGATLAASLFVWESFYLRLLGFALFLAGCAGFEQHVYYLFHRRDAVEFFAARRLHRDAVTLTGCEQREGPERAGAGRPLKVGETVVMTSQGHRRLVGETPQLTKLEAKLMRGEREPQYLWNLVFLGFGLFFAIWFVAALQDSFAVGLVGATIGLGLMGFAFWRLDLWRRK